MGSWAYEDDFEDVLELSDAGIALHLLKSVFFLNGPKKKHWNSVKHPRDANGRWAHTFGQYDSPGRSSAARVYGTSRTRSFTTHDGIPNTTATIGPGDRVYQTRSGSHVIVRPDGSGTYVGKDGKQVQLTGKGVDSHLGTKGSNKDGSAPKLVDHQPGIQVHAKNDAEAEKVLQQHEAIDKKYAEKHPEQANYVPKHSDKTSSSADIPNKENPNDFSALNLQPGDELRRNAKDNNQTMILHLDGSSTLFDANTGKAVNSNISKTQGLLLGNKDVSDAMSGKKSWGSLDARGISASQKTIDQRWPIIHKEPMTSTTFNHSEHGPISANYADAKNVVAKEHPQGIAVRNTHTGSTLVHKKDGTVSKFSGSVNDFNSLPDATHQHSTLGGTTPTNIGTKNNQKNSFRQNQQEAAKGIKHETLGGIDSSGNLTLPKGSETSATIVIENETELNLIMKTFEQLGIKEINGVPLEEYFNVKGKK